MTIEIQREPTHPGKIPGDMLEDTGLSVTAFARALHVSRQLIHRVLNADAPISPCLAVKLGLFLGNGAEIWLSLQLRHDLWLAQQTMNENIVPYQATG